MWSSQSAAIHILTQATQRVRLRTLRLHSNTLPFLFSYTHCCSYSTVPLQRPSSRSVKPRRHSYNVPHHWHRYSWASYSSSSIKRSSSSSNEHTASTSDDTKRVSKLTDYENRYKDFKADSKARLEDEANQVKGRIESTSWFQAARQRINEKSAEIRERVLDEERVTRLTQAKQFVKKYKDYIPIIREPRLFIAPRPAADRGQLSLSYKTIHIVKEVSVFAVSYVAALSIPHLLHMTSLNISHSFVSSILQPFTLVSIYVAYVIFTPMLPPPPKGRPGFLWAMLRQVRSLLLTTLAFILWNIPLMWCIKMWLGILWSDVDQVSKLMTGYEYDIVSFVFLKPFIEELVFRGLLFARLCRICGSLPAAVISSAAFAMTYSYKNENVNLQVFNDAFWVGFVLCYTMRLSGRLWLPVVLRYGASFLVYTQCESASPLNADDNDSSKKEMREMIGEVLYWLLNNKVTPMKDIEAALFSGEKQLKIHQSSLQELSHTVFELLDRDHKNYLSPHEFAYFFTLFDNVPFVLSAALHTIHDTHEPDDDKNIDQQKFRQLQRLYPSSGFIQVSDKQIEQVGRLIGKVDSMEKLQSVIDANSTRLSQQDEGETTSVGTDEHHVDMSLFDPTSNSAEAMTRIYETTSVHHKGELKRYYSYYNDLCDALVNSRVIKSLPSYSKLKSHVSSPHRQLDKKLFYEFIRLRALVDERSLYATFRRFFDVALHDSSHPLAAILINHTTPSKSRAS